MDYDQIKKVMKDLEESKLEELSFELPDGTKVSMKKAGKTPVSQTEIVEKEITTQEVLDVTPEKKVEGNIVKSPMVGTFYAKSSPDAKPYVEIGSKVKKGDVLCIVEAMKLMNEIESEFDGEIVDILVNDGEMVDYGKEMFVIK
ncbi:MAG: acetyl-CoA carboxylase biotin carboxyl carrier protein [Clostridia bacterium]|nr:acetyl-CoA carboxylase biotin carboxyl carrier protein [Clostridia bacterium]